MLSKRNPQLNKHGELIHLLSIEGLPHLQAWMARMEAKPACQKGITIPPRNESPEDLVKRAQQMVTR